MIVLRYSRSGAARFVSHIDVLRQFSRIMRRAGVPVAYSNGFNPHALLFFSPPTPVGIGSSAEYVAADTPLSPEETLARYNAAVTEDMRASAAFYVPRNPNLAGRTAAADYVFPFPADAYDFSRGLTLDYVKKGVRVTEEAGDRIFAVGEEDGRLKLTLASGNVTLRADRVFEAIAAAAGIEAAVTDVVKTAQYLKSADGTLVETDVALAGEGAEIFGK